MSYSSLFTISFHSANVENINDNRQSTKKQTKKIVTISIACMSIFLILAIVGIVLVVVLRGKKKNLLILQHRKLSHRAINYYQ